MIVLRALAGANTRGGYNSKGNLRRLDLSGATFKTDDGNSFLILGSGEDFTGYGLQLSANTTPDHAFYRCANLVWVSLPTETATISNQTFDHCWNTKYIDNANGSTYVKQLGIYAFDSCAVKYMNFPALEETLIHQGCWQNNRYLEHVKLATPGNIVSIGPTAFQNCAKMHCFQFSDAMKFIGVKAFYGCRSMLINHNQSTETEDNESNVNSTLTLPSTLGSKQFTYTASAGDQYALTDDDAAVGFEANGQGALGKESFRWCSQLTRIVNNAHYEKINDFTFADTEQLGTVELNTTRNLGYGAFAQTWPLLTKDSYDEEFRYVYDRNNADGKGNEFTPATETITFPSGYTAAHKRRFFVVVQSNNPQTYNPSYSSIKDTYGTLHVMDGGDGWGMTTNNASEISDGSTTIDPFWGIGANYTTVVFKGDAATRNYSSNSDQVENKDYGGGWTKYLNNAGWKRILTKKMSEWDDVYEVQWQRHALVDLSYNLRKGWNVICLPWAAAVNWANNGRSDKTGYNKDINNPNEICDDMYGSHTADYNYQGEADSRDDFRVAVYKDYSTSGAILKFCYFTRTIDPLEPFLVYMPTAKTSVTFTDVDVNGIRNQNKRSGENVYIEVKTPWDITSDMKVQGSGDYRAVGSLYKRYITTNGLYYLGVKDGVTQFFVTSGADTNPTKYGVLGFHGFFKPKDIDNAELAKEALMSLFTESELDDDIVSGIAEVDTPARATMGAVYGINGQQVRTHAGDIGNLPKGIYVIGGRKVVIK